MYNFKNNIHSLISGVGDEVQYQLELPELGVQAHLSHCQMIVIDADCDFVS